MPSIPEKIREFLHPITEASSVFIVDVSLRGERTSKVIEVYVDSDKGITLEECSDISRKLSVRLDEENIIEGRYRLDVSSPGLDKPLKLQRQYLKNIGRRCKVKYIEEGKPVVLEGVLESADDTKIVIQHNRKQTTILFSAVIETFIIPQIK